MGGVRGADGEAVDVPALCGDLRARSTAGRVLVGLCGPPGVGKSTLAAALVDDLGHDVAVAVPLDGFHLASNLLAGTPLAARRGAIDTFDADGFAALLERVRTADEVVYAPSFGRDLEEPVNASIAVRPDHRVVVVEGNYLLADGRAWERGRAHLDVVWYLVRDDEARVADLVERHVATGRSRPHAEDVVARSDEANARLVAATAHRADRVIRLADGRRDGSAVAGEQPLHDEP